MKSFQSACIYRLYSFYLFMHSPKFIFYYDISYVNYENTQWDHLTLVTTKRQDGVALTSPYTSKWEWILWASYIAAICWSHSLSLLCSAAKHTSTLCLVPIAAAAVAVADMVAPDPPTRENREATYRMGNNSCRRKHLVKKGGITVSNIFSTAFWESRWRSLWPHTLYIIYFI